MKCKNRDVNVVERANIPKFSKLDDIMTSLRLLKLLVDITVGNTKLYSHKEIADISFETIRFFLSMQLLSGC